jgi:hypothetical protein
MAGSKLYTSEKFMRQRYLRQRKSPQEIADECGVTLITVYRYLDKFGLKR